MTKLAVSIFAEGVEGALAQAAVAAERGAEMVEYRLDRFAEPPGHAAELVKRSPLPCIVACRSHREGGEYAGDEESRIALLESATAGNPTYVDVDLASQRLGGAEPAGFWIRPGLAALPPVVITRVEGGRFSALPAHRRMKAAKRWALDHIRGTYVNEDTRWEIIVSSEGAKEAAGKSPEPFRLDAIEAIPRLIAHAVLVRTHSDEKGRAGIVAVHRFYAALAIGSSLYRVKLTILEHSDGKKFYNHELNRIKKEAPVRTPSPAGEPGSEALAGASTISISDLLSEIKTYALPARSGPATILSSHDTSGRPADLIQRVESMSRDGACAIVKIAWRARSLRDNLEAFELLRDRVKPMIALCMGPFGLPSRVLAKKFGAFMTFAGLDDSEVTAPGQVGVATMKKLYRWDSINARTLLYGVIGWPVEHSISPRLHNAGFDAVAHNAVYLPLPIPPEYEHFKATVGAFLDDRRLDFRGASVTAPHKENLIRFVKERGGEIDPLAQRIGAANTLTVREDGSILASNTDSRAALGAMGGENLRGLRVAVLGAGGVARAVVAGLTEYGADVAIHNRTRERAEALASEFGVRLGADPFDADVIVHCTPVGMVPEVGATPIERWPDDWRGKPPVVFDTVYNPRQTRLLREAAARGCKTISGVEMFVRQAEAQFELWTGEPSPSGLFESIMREAQ